MIWGLRESCRLLLDAWALGVVELDWPRDELSSLISTRCTSGAVMIGLLKMYFEQRNDHCPERQQCLDSKDPWISILRMPEITIRIPRRLTRVLIRIYPLFRGTAAKLELLHVVCCRGVPWTAAGLKHSATIKVLH